MPIAEDHIELANKNHEALEYLLHEADHYPEWVVTVAFYKALHVVETVFCEQDGHHCEGHNSRLEKLKSSRYSKLHKQYRPLWAASTVARYLHDRDANKPYSTFADYTPPDEVKRQFVEKRLYRLEQEAVTFLGEPLRKDLKKVEPGRLP